jgi:prephenate dehydrogenase
MPVEMPADLHDRTTAHISHLPHVVATLLVNAVASAEDTTGSMRRLAAGGFKDLTRIASASPELWTGICLSNRIPLTEALVDMQKGLDGFLTRLQSGDAVALGSLFERGRIFRNSLSDIRTSLLPGHVEMTVDVEDKPGIIARISTALADQDINIKNIGINNVREEDEGALLIRFESEEEGTRAAQVLMKAGYGVRFRA